LGFGGIGLALVGQAGGGLAEVRCSLADPRIGESSGVASASWSDDVVFTHNDSGDAARFFALDARTCATRAVFTVRGAANTDWEDMARATAADGAAVLWLADIGDNSARRSGVVVYEVAEPGADSTGGTLPVRARMELTYPDGPRDAEALLVDPETGRPVVVTKDGGGGRSRVYRAPGGGSGTLEVLTTLDVKALPGGSLASPAWSVTAGDTSPDRRHVVLRSYLSVWVWSAAPGESLATVLARPPVSLNPPFTRQPEAAAFTRDGTGLWLTTEGGSTPLHLLPLEAQPAAAPATTTATQPEPVATPDRPLTGLVALGAGAVVLAAAAVILLTRRTGGPG
jgi:hypothetical protein